jgi:17beta-estradiol 17-dehydrogenase / 3beta-hydroxysteroid 3-dehydrogenase
MNDKKELQGKVVMVTGASSGIGRAISLALAKEGMRLAIVARNLDKLVTLKAQIESYGGRAFPLAVDLKDESQILFAFEAIGREWGGVDVLINSAGLGHDAPLSSGRTEHFREMLEVNVLALSVITREAVLNMQANKTAGQIIHISSMSAYRVQTGAGMYAATKHAVRAMTEGLRRELREAGSSIRVTAVSPADTETEFMERMLGRQEAGKRAPEYRQMDPEDIAQAVLYILKTPPHVEIHDILMRPINQPD